MAAIDDTRKRGRPPTGAIGVHVRLLPDDVAALDKWIAEQDSAPTRPEAIRRLVTLGLSVVPHD